MKCPDCAYNLLECCKCGTVFRINEWISVKDRLPQEEGEYLCYLQSPKTKSTLMIQRTYLKKIGFVPYEHMKIMSHWMSLPEPPKAEE